MYTRGSSPNSIYANNSAAYAGGVMYTQQSSLNITNSIFTNNAAEHYGGVMVTIEGLSYIANSTFDQSHIQRLHKILELYGTTQQDK